MQNPELRDPSSSKSQENGKNNMHTLRHNWSHKKTEKQREEKCVKAQTRKELSN
jgi:hypothetical protein